MSESSTYVPSAFGRKFHALTVHEALGGGSAGPGKSLTLLMDPVEQMLTEHRRTLLDKNHPHHIDPGMSAGWCLHVRRTRPMLDQTIARSHRFFPRLDPGAKWDAQHTTWTFSSGYRYQFGHCRDSNSYEQYMSNEYCMAAGERVVMADGSLKAIEAIVAGDLVQTLEGPRPVTATWETGVKPCVFADVQDRSGYVGTHVFPTTHPVLTLTSAGSLPAESHGSPHNERPVPSCEYAWQDYESRLCGLPRSPGKRESIVSAETGLVECCGSLLEVQKLPELTVHVVLHGPVRRSDSAIQGSPRECHERAAIDGRSPGKYQAASRPRLLSRMGRPPTPVAALRSQGRIEAIAACGDEGGRTGCEIATGCGGSCCVCPRLRGGQPRLRADSGQERPRRPGGAETRTPSDRKAGGQECIPSDSQGNQSSYPHFYSGESRPLTEAVRTGTLTMRFAGWAQTFDLTVEGANHYVTEYGLVSSQTYFACDELVQMEEDQYDNIAARVRSTDPVLSKMLKVRSMTNPMLRTEGDFTVKNPYWVRERFVDPAPEGGVILSRKIRLESGEEVERTRIYLKALLKDNPNPEFVRQYEASLRSMKPHFRQALLEANWYVVAGAYYSDVWDPNIHVCRPFRIPDEWPQFRMLDWGFKKPGCCYWGALDPDDNIYIHRELVFQNKTTHQVAEEIKTRELEMDLWDEKRNKSLVTGPADTQLWEARGEMGKSKAAEFAEKGVRWTKADKRSRQRNAERIAERLADNDGGTTTPGLVVFANCKQMIKTLPSIPADPANPESPLDGGYDHPHDALGYGCAFVSLGRGVIPSRDTDDEDDDQDDKPASGGRGFGYGT